MAARRPRPSIGDFITNMQVPLPWPTKLRMLFGNLWLRIVKRQNCCGHEGQPGC